MIYPLYNGKVLLSFDEKKHSYVVEGEKIISVTQVSAPKPGLMFWAAEQASEYVRRYLVPGRAYDEIEIANLVEGARKAHSKTSGRAASIGTLAHQACETFAKSGRIERPVNEQAGRAFDQFIRWVGEHNVKFHASEAKVFHVEHRYAGTLDLDAEVGGQRCIVDLKTSNAIYPEYDLQLAAYAKARERELGIKYDSAWILRIPKDGGDFETKEVKDLDKPFEAFLGLLKYYQWAKD
jgi:hypothetical protein